ncbi:MAG: hypothetical protein IJ043_08420 [Clostridia bacterium]|nr:hypothetical protein [Clostridia bacterium]
MKKLQFKGWIGFGVILLIQLYMGSLYRSGGFGMNYAAVLLGAIVSVPSLLLYGYRQLGTLPAWLTAGACLPLLYYASQHTATTLLTWFLCFGGPLAVTFFWPRLQKLCPLSSYALPTAGLFWLGGVLVYSKLHFGSWQLSAVTERVAYRYGLMVDQMEQVYAEVYGGALPQQFQAAFEQLHAGKSYMGFYLVTVVAYALVGAYFLGIFLADRSLPAEHRWLGSWEALLPSKGVSMFYMIAYVLLMFMPDQLYQTLKAVLDLFGFFFVLAAVYYLLRWMRKKGLAPALGWIVAMLLFAMAFFSVGNVLLSPYSILMCVGLWCIVSPRKPAKN